MAPTSAPQDPVPILLMGRHLHQGGVERDLTKLALHLDRSRFTPHVATYFDSGIRFEELRAADVPLLHLPVTSIVSWSAVEAVWRLSRYVRQHRIALIHAFDSTSFLAAVVGRLVRCPIVLTSQLSYRSILDSRTALILRLSDRLTDAVQVNCEAVRRYMIDEEHVSADRLVLCHNGVDTSIFYPSQTRRPPELEGTGVVVGTVCALRPEKNLDLLQEGFASVRSSSPSMKLLIVGSGTELCRLRENATRLGIADVSVFVPATPEVATWMQAIDIFVLPSYSEAFSNSLLEAMACGCAAIGSRVGGTPELIGDNERGLLFESGDAKGLSTQLQRLIDDEHQRRTLGSRAAAFAKEKLNLEIAIKRQSEIYQSLLSRKMAAMAQSVLGCPRRVPSSADLNERGGA
jgi:glycosyltransferase involved in cell wall biosynthesis